MSSCRIIHPGGLRWSHSEAVGSSWAASCSLRGINPIGPFNVAHRRTLHWIIAPVDALGSPASFLTVHKGQPPPDWRTSLHVCNASPHQAAFSGRDGRRAICRAYDGFRCLRMSWLLRWRQQVRLTEGQAGLTSPQTPQVCCEQARVSSQQRSMAAHPF